MADLPPLKFGKVVGWYLANIADGPDINDSPEFVPLAGTVTFTAEASKILVAGGQPDPATYVQLPKHYECPLDEFGYITWRGQRGVRLVAPGAETNPNAWTWRVSFALTYDGERVPLEPFSFAVPEYIPGPDPEHPDIGSTGLVDLTLVAPVPSSPGNAVVVGPRGEGIQIDGVVATYAALPASPADGVQYVVQADGLLYVYHAAQGGWLPNGQGIVIRGPQGLTGATGPAGPPNVLSIGTVTTGPAGSSASATIGGTSPAQTLSLTIPRGDTGTAPDATSTTKGLVRLNGILAGTADAPDFSSFAFGTTATTACRGNDPRLTDSRTPTTAGQIYDFAFVAQTGVRATGAGNVVPQGVKLQRSIRISKVTYRCQTADASGNLVVELRQNGTPVSGTSASIPAASQLGGGSVTGTWDLEEGDVLSVHITGVGTTPGTHLSADIKAVVR
ncbi:hypothetical protein [Nocardia sp. IFM 10818]